MMFLFLFHARLVAVKTDESVTLVHTVRINKQDANLAAYGAFSGSKLKTNFSTFSYLLSKKSGHAGLKIREKSGNADNFFQRSKYAGCYNFSSQETRNVLFRKSKEDCTV